MTRFHIVLAAALIAFLGTPPVSATWDDGVSAFNAGRYQEAADAFRSFLARSPEAPAGHYMLGQALLRQKRLEAALAVAPDDRSLRLALAQVAGRLDKPEVAFTALAAAFALDPKDAEVGRSAAHKAIAIAQEEDENEQRKIDWYRKGSGIARQLASAFPTPKNQLLAGSAMMGAKEYEGALEWFEKTLTAGTDDRLLRYYLGRSNLAIGKNQEALHHLRAALDHSGEDLTPEIHTARASALRNLERFDDAAGAYRLAGDAATAVEMEGYAKNRREWAAAKADCVEKRDQIAELLNGGDGLEDSPEWKELEQEAAAILAACEPYLQDHT